MSFIPSVLTSTPNGQIASDLLSHLLQQRIIMCQGPVDDNLAMSVTSQLLYLAAKSDDPIQMYINSPGGSVSAGLAIIDTMNLIANDICTVAMGMAASMGAVILSAGTKNNRYILPNAEVMIHQPSGGAQGMESDIIRQAAHITKIKDRLTNILAENCGKTIEQIAIDSDRDLWLDADDALAYGIVDKIMPTTSAK